MSDDETAERMIKSLQTHIKGVVGSEGFSTVSCSPSCPFRILPLDKSLRLELTRHAPTAVVALITLVRTRQSPEYEIPWMNRSVLFPWLILGAPQRTEHKFMGSKRLGKLVNKLSGGGVDDKQLERNNKIAFDHLINEMKGLEGSESFRSKETHDFVSEAERIAQGEI